MEHRQRLKHILLAAWVALMAGACGIPGIRPPATPTPVAVADTPTRTPRATRTPQATRTPEPSPTAEPLAGRLQRAALMVRVYGGGEPSEENLLGTGSGFLTRISGELVVATVAHVPAGATSITVVQGGSTRERAAALLGSASCNDLAVLKVDDLDGLEPVELGKSGKLRIGDAVSVAGFPLINTLGAPMTLTSGDISIDGTTTFQFLRDLTQYTAPTNPGASGAMVVDQATGAVVAIHTAGIGENMNYGIAIDAALPVLEDLARGAQRDWLGAAISEETLPSGAGMLVVRAVSANSPFGKAGVAPGDVLAILDGESIRSKGDMCTVLRSHRDGDTLDVGLLRPAGGTSDELVGRVTLSDPAGENWVRPLSAVRVLNPTPEQVGQAQASLAQARQGWRQAVFEVFSTNQTKYHFREQDFARFRGGEYELTIDKPNQLRSTLWQQHDRPDLRANVPRDPGPHYIVEADVAFKTFDSTTGVGIVVDQQANDDGIAFLVNRDNTFQILTWLDGKVTRRFSSERVAWAAMRGDTNTLRVVRTPEGLQFWINDAPVALMEKSPFPGGGVGVAILGGADLAAPARAIADNLRIETP